MLGMMFGVISLKAFEGKGILFDIFGLFLYYRLNFLFGFDDFLMMKFGVLLKKFVLKMFECVELFGFDFF